MTTMEIIKSKEETEKQVCEQVLDSIKDVQAGKGRDYKEFFDELERRYQSV